VRKGIKRARARINEEGGRRGGLDGERLISQNLSRESRKRGKHRKDQRPQNTNGPASTPKEVKEGHRAVDDFGEIGQADHQKNAKTTSSGKSNKKRELKKVMIPSTSREDECTTSRRPVQNIAKNLLWLTRSTREFQRGVSWR